MMLSEINRFGVPSSKKKKWDPSTLCYRLSADDIKLANSRLAIVNLPSQDFTPLNLFTSTAGLKSYNWKEVGIPYATIDNDFSRGGSLIAKKTCTLSIFNIWIIIEDG